MTREYWHWEMVMITGWHGWCDVCESKLRDLTTGSETEMDLICVMLKAGWVVTMPENRHVCRSCSRTPEGREYNTSGYRTDQDQTGTH